MTHSVVNSRIAAEAVRPNPSLWGSSRAEPFVMAAHESIASFAQTETARSLAGDDIAARLIVAEVVFDQVLALLLSPIAEGVGSPAIVEMAELVNKHTSGSRYIKIPLGESQAEVNRLTNLLARHYAVASGVWKFT